jgi:hypothetical protein
MNRRKGRCELLIWRLPFKAAKVLSRLHAAKESVRMTSGTSSGTEEMAMAIARTSGSKEESESDVTSAHDSWRCCISACKFGGGAWRRLTSSQRAEGITTAEAEHAGPGSRLPSVNISSGSAPRSSGHVTRNPCARFRGMRPRGFQRRVVGRRRNNERCGERRLKGGVDAENAQGGDGR